MGKTASAVYDKAKPDPERDRMIGDGDGLYMRIRPHGAKTWVVEYQHMGRRTKYTIGQHDRDGAPGDKLEDWLRHGRLSLTQARAIAGSWKQARKAGHDPAAEWEDKLAAERAAATAKRAAEAIEAALPTVSQAIDLFMAKIMAGKKSAPAIRYRFDRLAVHLGEKKIRDVTRQDLLGALDKIASGQNEGRTAKLLAGEVLTQARRLWRFAVVREWVAASPIADVTRRDVDATPNKRSVTLRLDEVAQLWRVLGDPGKCKADPVTVAALRLLILTGQREREVTDADWSEFDLDAGLWRIPATRTKKQRAHLVHLAPQAVAVLRELRKITGETGFAFKSPIKPKQAIFGRSVNNALLTLFKTDALPNVTQCTVHDLRRTLITRLPDLGFEPFVAHKVANHVLPGVLAVYNHAEYMEQREAALHAWAARIESLATGENVVQLHRVA